MKSQPQNNKHLFCSPDLPDRATPQTPPERDGDNESYIALRDLITGPEQRRLAEMQRRLDDPVQRAEEISHVLPEAMLLGTARDHRIAEALQPAMDNALKTSVRKNPKALVDAIYPILGPGIRKAVSSILMGMIQSLNRTLDMAFSIRGIKWRWQALRSNRTFAEIVLLNTLVYQVEQIFLIHRRTGLVIQHVSARDIASKDPDLVSGMLSAIQDFITDSFPSETSSSLETLRMGEGLSVMIEQGRHGFIAAVIRGTPPMELREKFRSMLDEIEGKYDAALEAFQGDTTPFIILANRLEEGLEQRIRTDAGRTSPLLWVVCLLVLLALAYLCYRPIHTARLWHDFIRNLRTHPGIVITDYGKENGQYYVSGLKDPLVPETEAVQAAFPFQTADLVTHWASYDALDPPLVLSRAEKLLSPPGTVRLSFSGGCLTARGTASHDWVSFFRRRAETITGIEKVNTAELKDSDAAALDAAADRLSAISITFPKDSSLPAAGQEASLTRVAETIEEIQMLSRKLGADVQIVLMGHTDESGSEAYNRRLSKDRADVILAYLVEKGLLTAGITTMGITSGISAPWPWAHETVTKRIVIFKTFYFIPEMESDTP